MAQHDLKGSDSSCRCLHLLPVYSIGTVSENNSALQWPQTHRRLFASSGCEIWQYQRQNEVIGGLRGVLDMALIFSGSSYIICANGSLSACLFLSAVLPLPQLVQIILGSLPPCLTSASRVVKLEFLLTVFIQQWKKADNGIYARNQVTITKSN